MNNAESSHMVVLSIFVLLGMAFVFQGIGDTSPGAHDAILWLLIGLVLLVGINFTANKSTQSIPNTIAKLPWLPPPTAGG